MRQYPGYEIERFEGEGGFSSCYIRFRNIKDEFHPKLELIPVIDLLGEDDDERSDRSLS